MHMFPHAGNNFREINPISLQLQKKILGVKKKKLPVKGFQELPTMVSTLRKRAKWEVKKERKNFKKPDNAAWILRKIS